MMRRRELVFLASQLLGTISLADDSGNSSDVSGFLLWPDSPSRRIFEIVNPGRYHLSKNEIQPQLWGAGHSWPNGGSMLNIYCGGVEIDFRGHTLGAKHGASGVTLFVGQNLHFRKSYPNKYGPASEDNRNVVLRNGVIDFTGGELTGLGVEFIDSWGSPSEFSGGNRPCIDRRHCQPKPISYVDNNYKLERLTVLTNDIAIAVEGSHTIIRDCIIESAGNAAIFIAGPNVTIENCEIRLKTPPASEVPDGEPKPRAAIVLRDASNAVIRNNRIRVDKGLQNTHCILIHDDAQGVSIENNTFINVDGDPVTKSEGSDVTMVDNKNEHRWWPR